MNVAIPVVWGKLHASQQIPVVWGKLHANRHPSCGGYYTPTDTRRVGDITRQLACGGGHHPVKGHRLLWRVTPSLWRRSKHHPVKGQTLLWRVTPIALTAKNKHGFQTPPVASTQSNSWARPTPYISQLHLQFNQTSKYSPLQTFACALSIHQHEFYKDR